MKQFVVLPLLLSAVQLFAQAPVPMHEEPRHRLVLTHHHVKLMDVKIPPGDTTLFHVHDVPALYIAVSVSPVDIQVLGGTWNGTLPTADPGRMPGGVNLDTSYVRRAVTHRVTNVGTKLFNLVAVTNSNPSPDADVAADLPGVIEIRNRWFTQSRVQLLGDAGDRWYSAGSPTVVVQALPGSATVLLSSGEERILETPGSWALVPRGARYQLSTDGSATLVVVQVM